MTETDTVEKKPKIERQVSLPLSKAVEIGFRNMRVRFGRTLITAGGVVLGIAFLTFVWQSQVIFTAFVQNGPEEVIANLTLPGDEAKAQQIWLVTLSLLVSAVGITNAMLMAVTERYREIGTMKCLGALDAFVVKMFLVESGFQGFVGSGLGCIIGITLALIQMLAKYGSSVLGCIPVGTMAGYALVALAIGMFLSTISAIYPAYVAAKMVPADALRSEF